MRRISIAVLALAAFSLWVGFGVAATPSTGTVSSTQDVVWQGGPFTASNPAACVGSADPTCDHFFLTVDAPGGTNVLVAIDGAGETDDYDLFVYHPDGTLAGQKATGGGNESVVFEHGTAHGSGPYEVRVQPFLVSPGSTYAGAAQVSQAPVDGEPRECLEPVPPTVALDVGQAVSLSVVTLLDGVSLARGSEVMTKAADAYAPLNIALESQFQTVAFTGDEAEGLIQQAKDLLGGERPSAADIVYVLTSKNIQSGGNTSVAGLADCIGGVRFPERAFAVGENISENDPLGPFVTTLNGTAVVAAHEIGHLMGGHHHYANCVEGIDPDEVLRQELTPCTLMFNAVDTASLDFSTVNGAVVRGHAVGYAAP